MPLITGKIPVNLLPASRDPAPVLLIFRDQTDLLAEEGLVHVHEIALFVLEVEIGFRPFDDLDHHRDIAILQLPVEEV